MGPAQSLPSLQETSSPSLPSLPSVSRYGTSWMPCFPVGLLGPLVFGRNELKTVGQKLWLVTHA